MGSRNIGSAAVLLAAVAAAVVAFLKRPVVPPEAPGRWVPDED